MCVIAYKPKNVRWMSKSDMKDCWDENPHGAGVMWRDEESKTIRFKKGFMKYDDLEKWCDDNMDWLENTECAVHFRITTHGGTSKGNCHPFVCDFEADPHLLEGSAPYVLMHNGILDITPRRKDISDSAELALRIGEYENPQHVMSIFGEMLTGNRVIVMGPDGTEFYGDPFVDPLKNGWLYSNDHFIGGGEWWGYKINRPFSTGKCARYDKEMEAWIDHNGFVVGIDEIDPDSLSDSDWAEYKRQIMSGDYDVDERIYEWLSVNGYDIDVAESEAAEYGMTLDEYVCEYLAGGFSYMMESIKGNKERADAK